MASPDTAKSLADLIPEPPASRTPTRTSTGSSAKQGLLIGAAVLAAILLGAALGRYVWAPAASQCEGKDAVLDEAVEAATQDDGSDQRLPQDVLPVSYRLHVWPVLAEAPPGKTNFTFEGRLALTVRVVAEGGADRVSLHVSSKLGLRDDDIAVFEDGPGARTLAKSWGMAWEKEDAETSPTRRVRLVEIRRTASWDLLEVVVGERLVRDGLYVVLFRFNGTLGRSLTGLYHSSYEDPATNTTRWLALTQMQAVYARDVFPCMDEPRFRTPFTISVASSNVTTALSNAPLASTSPIEGAPGWQWYHFEQSIPMPTYLVAFVVTDFSYASPRRRRAGRAAGADQAAGGGGEVEVRMWTRPAAVAQAQYVVDIAPRILEYYGQFFGVPYALPKMDLVAVPHFAAGGMENWGLVILNEQTVLSVTDKKTDSPNQYENMAKIVAHELGHQWLGNLVTNAWWDGLWLNEGFTTYMQWFGVDHVEPSWQVLDRFQSEEVWPTLQEDAMLSSRALAAPMRTKADIDQAFDTVAYDKGACLLRMLHHCLGNEAFQRGVRRYIKTWQHNSTTEARLWEAIEDAVKDTPSLDPWHMRLPENKTVADVMTVWTTATGIPVVNVTRDKEAGKLVFTQQRFLHQGCEASNCTRQRWVVPLSLVTSTEAARNASLLSDTRPRAWLVDEDLTLDLEHPDDWVVVNTHQTGIFRVNYDLDNWRQLVAQVRSGTLPAAVRAQLLDDAFWLAYAGQLPYDVPLNMTLYLPAKERDPRPWVAALYGLSALRNRGSASYSVFRRFKQRLLEPMWELLPPPDRTSATTSSETLTHSMALLRNDLVADACAEGLHKCQDWAARAVHLWRLEDDPDANNPTPEEYLRDAAYCSAVRTGTSDVWDFMWQRHLAAKGGRTSPLEWEMIRRALTCSRDPSRVVFLLEQTLNDTSSVGFWDDVAFEEVGSLVLFRYFREHWPTIRDKFGVDTPRTNSFVKAAINSLPSSEAGVRDLEAFLEEHKQSLGSLSRTFEAAIDFRRAKIAWRRKYLPPALKWMEEVTSNPAAFL